ncbi:hypothetical protein AWW68_15090 [Roseivirga spongicola]|uniref:Uncharacterized protein n=1 Tax=Roseivirga spongicola TaxID=333140 RepID=A0A150X5I0_9BACT|nr:hypothetical protein AWW68_15090 [Roseivirga spongicola]
MGVNMEKGRFIGQTNRAGLLSRHNRCPHRLIAHVAGLVPEFRHGEDTMTGGVQLSTRRIPERILQSTHL